MSNGWENVLGDLFWFWFVNLVLYLFGLFMYNLGGNIKGGIVDGILFIIWYIIVLYMYKSF